MTPQSDVSLAPLCTMGVGGPARWFVEARRESEVAAALHWAERQGVPVYVLGGGSNVVIADDGFDGLVVKIDIRESVIDDRDGSVVVGAGEPWDPVVEATVRANLAGFECLSGIPGCVGGTPIQNVGAYGQDVSGTIARVWAVDRHTGRTVAFSREECQFGYRTSRFKREDANRFVVTRVEYALAPAGPPTLAYADVIKFFQEVGIDAPSLHEVRDAILVIRRRKGMVIERGNPANRSCGSFFVNPVVSRNHLHRVQSDTGGPVPHFVVGTADVKIPAAWLIEQAGFTRGTTRGEVGISPFQAQAIINRGGARASAVLDLAVEVKAAVWERFAIALVPEPIFVGFSSEQLRRMQHVPGERVMDRTDH
jgi:UDP-N-acetylmuramate dehydrogenase